MILNASFRTDIPAFYSEWFFNRLKAGFVLVRNPYYPSELLQMDFDPSTIDLITFCTKDPSPMLDRIEELNDYHIYFQVSITPYDQDLEPNVKKVKEVIHDTVTLACKLGKKNVVVRYDPIIITDYYTVDYHIFCFEKIVQRLSSYIDTYIISFVDLYEKSSILTEVSYENRERIAEAFGKIAKKYGVNIKTCAEISYEKYGIQKSGCLSKEVVESLIGTNLKELSHTPSRNNCNCIASRDIGEYDTCLHGCKYCYATDHLKAIGRYLQHDPYSPLLIGDIQEGDVIHKIKQDSLIDPQLSLFWGNDL